MPSMTVLDDQMRESRQSKIKYEALIPLAPETYTGDTLELQSYSIEELISKLYFVRDRISDAIDELQRIQVLGEPKEEYYA